LHSIAANLNSVPNPLINFSLIPHLIRSKCFAPHNTRRLLSETRDFILNRFRQRLTARNIRKALGFLICLLGTFGIIMSAAGLRGSRDLASKTTAIMVAPFREDLKTQGISDQSVAVILRGGLEATNLLQSLNSDQQKALKDFQETHATIFALMTQMAEASESSARAGLFLSIIILLVGAFVFRFRSIPSPPTIPSPQPR
jgi:hypothetical protein